MDRGTAIINREEKGQCVIVTGGAKGIGRAVVTLFAEKGFDVVFGDMDEEAGRSFVEELNRGQDRRPIAYFVPGDIAEHSHLEQLFTTASQKFGGAQVVVNNAGVFPPETMDGELGFIQRIAAVNFEAVVRGTYMAIQHFGQQQQPQVGDGDGKGAAVSQGGYCIVNVSSLITINLLPGNEVYGATKAGVAYLTKALAHLHQSRNIRINAVLPTFIRAKRVLENSKSRAMIKEIFGKGLPPSAVAESVYALVADPRRRNGENLIVDEHHVKLLPKL